MSNFKKSLAKRYYQLTTPTPTISIFRGKRWLASDTGAQGSREEVYVQFDVTFRKTQLAQLKGPLLAVLMSIALHINEKGYSAPSVALIAKETGFNKDTVHNAIPKLEKMGFISKMNRPDPRTRKFRSNVYRIFPRSWKTEANQPRRI